MTYKTNFLVPSYAVWNFMMGNETFLNIADDGLGRSIAGKEDKSTSRVSICSFENKVLLLS